MSLLLSVLTFLFVVQQYWISYGGEVAWHTDQWSLLRALGIAIAGAAIVHRVAWISLNKFDNQFNHPPPIYTDMSQIRVYDTIRARLKGKYQLNERSSQGQNPIDKEIIGSRYFDLVSANPFLLNARAPKGYSQWRGANTTRGLDHLNTPLKPLFRLLSGAAWWNGDLSVNLNMHVSIVGLDDNCTYVKIDFQNIASPPVLNIWGPLERSTRMREIKNALDVRSDRYAAGKRPRLDVKSDQSTDEDKDIGAPQIASDAVPIPDTPRTEEEFNIAWAKARQNDPIAQWQIGNVFRDGQLVDRDFSQAAKCYALAADHGYPHAQYQLSLLIRDGRGVPQNRQAAFEMCKRAAAGGHAEPMYELGLYLLDGKVTARDIDDAFKWLLKASELGHAGAQCRVAGLLASYEDLPGKDGRGSLYWYQEAARRGNIEAQVKLALTCLEGRDKETNYREAFRWFQKAAFRGDAYSQVYLGQMYLYGGAVDQNLRRAEYWLGKAAEQRYPKAEAELNFVRQALSKYPE